jgi:hypothetical protein
MLEHFYKCIWFTVRKRAFATPFITGSVGAGNLKIPIHRDKTFPFSWVKPITGGSDGVSQCGYPFSWWPGAGCIKWEEATHFST